AELAPLIQGRDPTQRVFLNRRHQPLTRYGIHALVERYAHRLGAQIPSLKSKRVSPHTIRHTTATFSLRAGVDINTIRAWLGHVSINTTNIYAEVDLNRSKKDWHRQFLSGTTVSAKKTVPEETICAFNYRT